MHEALFKALKKLRKTQKNFRVIEAGVFVNESSISNLSQKVSQFHRQLTDQRLPADDALDAMLDLAGEQVHYLIEDDLLWTGYVIPFKDERMRDWPRTYGEIVSCRDYLHPKDREFDGHKNLKLLEANEEENIAEFLIKDRIYKINGHAFEGFVEGARKCEDLIEAFDQSFEHQSDLMHLLYRLVKKSVPVEKKDAAAQVIKYNNQAEYRKARNWIFEFEQDVLKACYDGEALVKLKAAK